jgi:hypothetical protein
MVYIVAIVLVVLFIFCVPFRVAVLHPVSDVFYGVKDFINYIRYRQWNNLKTGKLLCFIGLFGKGKTLASVHYVVKLYRRYNNRKVYDFDRNKWVMQKVNVLSNVDLNIPYVKFEGLQQIVDVSKAQHNYDYANDILTCTVVLGDEFSVQLNSRNFKKNIDPLFLNTLLTCRHHHITLVYNAQRFGHVDALLRQVTSSVIDCNKIWRFMCHAEYDAWELENATTPSMVKARRKYGWFIKDKDYNAYDTLACVDNLTKACEDGDLLTEEEIIALQSNNGSDMEVVSHPSRKYKRIQRRLHK